MYSAFFTFAFLWCYVRVFFEECLLHFKLQCKLFSSALLHLQLQYTAKLVSRNLKIVDIRNEKISLLSHINIFYININIKEN